MSDLARSLNGVDDAFVQGGCPEQPVPSAFLWAVGDWHCELNQGRRMRLLKDAELVAEQAVDSPQAAEHLAAIWRAAVSDVEAHRA